MPAGHCCCVMLCNTCDICVTGRPQTLYCTITAPHCCSFCVDGLVIPLQYGQYSPPDQCLGGGCDNAVWAGQANFPTDSMGNVTQQCQEEVGSFETGIRVVLCCDIQGAEIGWLFKWYTIPFMECNFTAEVLNLSPGNSCNPFHEVGGTSIPEPLGCCACDPAQSVGFTFTR